MPDHHAHQTDTSAADRAFLDGLARFHPVLRNPFIVGFLAVAAAALLFRAGILVGEAAFLAFEGDGPTTAVFGATLVALVAAVVAAGAWLDGRRRSRDRRIAQPGMKDPQDGTRGSSR
jgi:hypothetical protein